MAGGSRHEGGRSASLSCIALLSCSRRGRSWLAASLLIWLCVAASHFPLCATEIIRVHLERDARLIIPFDRFAFDDTGVVNMTVKNVEFFAADATTPPRPPLSRMAFALFDAEPGWLIKKLLEMPADQCLLDLDGVETVADFGDVLRALNFAVFQKSYAVREGKECCLALIVCGPLQFPLPLLSMDAEFSFYNVRNGRPDFLPSGLSNLPTLCFFFFSLFALAAATWILLCLRNKETVHSIHILMTLVVVLIALSCLTAAVETLVVQRTGLPRGWLWLRCIFRVLASFSFDTLILLLGSGWSFLKPVLDRRSKRVIAAILPLLLLAEIGSAVTHPGWGGEAHESDPGRLAVMLFSGIVEVVACFLLPLPAWWSVRYLTEQEASRRDSAAPAAAAAPGGEKSPWLSVADELFIMLNRRPPEYVRIDMDDGGKKVGVIRMRRILFRQFFALLVLYLVFTNLIPFKFRLVFGRQQDWVLSLVLDSALLIFCVLVGCIFRPAEGGGPFCFRSNDWEMEMEMEEEEFVVQQPLQSNPQQLG